MKSSRFLCYFCFVNWCYVFRQNHPYDVAEVISSKVGCSLYLLCFLVALTVILVFHTGMGILFWSCCFQLKLTRFLENKKYDLFQFVKGKNIFFRECPQTPTAREFCHGQFLCLTIILTHNASQFIILCIQTG